MPLRRERQEMHGRPQRNSDTAEPEKAAHNEESPMPSPANRIPDPIHASQHNEHSQRCLQSQQHGEHISKPPARIGPQPPRGAKLYRHPNARKGQEILPSSARFPLRRGSQRHRHKNKTSRRPSPRERKSICPQPVNQVCKERGGAQCQASARTEARPKRVCNAARSKKQHHQ